MDAPTSTRICANRGCGGVVSAAQFTKCALCLSGLRKVEKMVAQFKAVEAMPPLLLAGAWAFRVPGIPIAWNNALERPSHGRPYLTEKAREWKQSIRIIAKQTRPRGWDLHGRYMMDLHSVFANPRADRDGPLKLVQDALKGIAWRDDNQVFDGATTKAVDDRAPRIEVVVRLAESQRAAA